MVSSYITKLRTENGHSLLNSYLWVCDDCVYHVKQHIKVATDLKFI